MARIFIGVAWPYANNAQHFGHLAGVYLPADIFARYHRMKGNEVLMVSGSDMHGTPTAVAAEKEGVAPEVEQKGSIKSITRAWRNSASPTTSSRARRRRGMPKLSMTSFLICIKRVTFTPP
jgi:methionyl-tRNA synthetase